MELQLTLAQELMESGNAKAAVSQYENLLDEHGRDPRVHVLLANALFELNKLGRAEARYWMAVRLDPQRAEAYIGLARCVEEMAGLGGSSSSGKGENNNKMFR